MRRDYTKWHSGSLGREMELLVFGEGGMPVMVFPTSGGRFFEFEDHGMVRVLGDRVEAGQLQLFCLDSTDRESWYAHEGDGRSRIERQLAFERYVLEELLPVVQAGDAERRPMALGCSFGGYHAVNLALRHPDKFSGFVALSGIFDLAEFLDGYYDTDCYLNLPTHYLPNLTERRYLDAYRKNRYVLATGWDDQCLSENQHLDRLLTEKGVAHEFHIWNGLRTHDWPTWQRMVSEYL